jgi:DNA modification methylase
VELTGFSTGEVDLLIDGKTSPAQNDPADDVSGVAIGGVAVSRLGDVWQLGRHLLVCGNALNAETFQRLMGEDRAQMVLTDPPYNLRIQDAVGRGRTKHREFPMASGELSQSQFATFLTKFIRQLIDFSVDGSIHYLFMDWRHLSELLQAALPLYDEWKNLLVWNKPNGGQGSFYRSKHELIAAFKKGSAAHVNNFKLGADGRYRSNVLDYPSVNSLHPARKGDLEDHPTVKPVALFADLMRDCSRRNGVILDPFGGSGTTILAAERTGRIARVIELDPIYVDVAIRRCEKAGLTARLAGSGLTFAEVKQQRAADNHDSLSPPVRKPTTARSRS